MKLGTENKKETAALAALLLVAGYLVYSNMSSDSAPAHSSVPKSSLSERSAAAGVPQTDAPPAGKSTPITPSTTPRTQASRSRSDDFRPVFRSKRPEDRTDRTDQIDPTIHVEILQKVQSVKLEAASRNLFQFGAAPKVEAPKGPEPIVAVNRPKMDYPRPKVEPAPPPPPPPEAPPTLKYYGVAAKQVDGKKTAFFLDTENNIILAPEGGMIQKKYKVMRVGVSSVQLENTESKKQHSLPLAEDAGANMSN